MTVIRTPAVAGQFYSSDPEELKRTVAALLSEAQDGESVAPKALIVPHAGYVYSGPVAATAYLRLRPFRDRYERVVLLGPSHRTPLQGLALSSADVYRMPMGDVRLDKVAIDRLDIPGVHVADRCHEFEHSLEVHLPFLQSVLNDFLLVPVVVGDAEPGLVADVLDTLWGGPETLVIVSSDLSHYLHSDEARTIDRATCEAIEHLDIDGINHRGACGATPVRGLLLAARRHEMRATTLDLRNSGDTAGGKAQVVGYGSWIFT